MTSGKSPERPERRPLLSAFMRDTHVDERFGPVRHLIEFMSRLVKDSNKKIFLILDNLRVHHSYIVRDWLEEHEDEIEAFFLPSYSPELNPDEYLNCDLKTGVHPGTPARTKKELKKKAISHLRKLQKLPGRVKKYFKHPKIAYAA